MDFHVLPRRELQALCKKNRIRANMTSLAMADALQAMDTVEGIGEIQESLQFLSPKKADLISPSLPRTARRTSSCRAGPTQDELKERQGSPLPRSRRVTAKASEIMKTIDEPEEVKEGSMKEVAKTPKAPNTRRRASKKEEGMETPAAPRAVTTMRRATKKEEKKGEKEEVEKEEKTVGVMIRRRTRPSVGWRRSTRASVMKMGVLAGEEEEEEEEEEREGKDEAEDSSSNLISEASISEQNNSFDLISGKKFEGPLMEDEVKIPVETKEEEKDDADKENQTEKEGKDGEQDPDLESTAAIQEGGLGSNEIQEDESSATEPEMPLEEVEKKSEQDPIDAVPGFEGSPVGGLIEDQHQTLFAEIKTDEQKGEMSEGVDLDVNLPNPTEFTFSPLAVEIAVEAIESSKIANSPQAASSSPLRSLIEDRIVSEVSVNGEQGPKNGRSVGIYTEESNDKENSRDLSWTRLTALGPTAEELKAKEKPGFNGLSLRKLKSLYREKAVGEKRAALKALDENCL